MNEKLSDTVHSDSDLYIGKTLCDMPFNGLDFAGVSSAVREKL